MSIEKKIIAIAAFLFILSITYVPEIYDYKVVMFTGYKLIWNLENEIYLTLLIIEWISIAVLSSLALLFFRKS